MRYYEHFRKSYWSSNNDRKLNFWTGPRQNRTKWVFITWEIRTLKSPRPWSLLYLCNDMYFLTAHVLWPPLSFDSRFRPPIWPFIFVSYFGHQPFQLPILTVYIGLSFWPAISLPSLTVYCSLKLWPFIFVHHFGHRVWSAISTSNFDGSFWPVIMAVDFDINFWLFTFSI